MSVTKRDAAKKQMLLLSQWLKHNINTITLVEAEDALRKLEQFNAEFMAQHSKIMEVTGAAEAEFQKIEGADVAQLYGCLRDQIAKHILLLKEQPSTSKATTNTRASTDACPPAAGSSTESRPPAQQPTTSLAKPGTSASAAGPSAGIRPPAQQHDANENVIQRMGLVIRNMCTAAIKATVEDTSANMANTQVALLNQYWTSYTSAMFADWSIDINDDFNSLQMEFMRATSHLASIVDAHNQQAAVNNNPAPNAGAAAANQEVKLPTIKIPTFSGSFNDWSSFYDLFVSMVDSSTSLTNVQKMHYLRSSVQGDAEKLIRTYKITEANYTAAWTALKERYNNRRLIINAHLDQIFDIAKCTSESASSMRNKLDTLAEAVRSLNSLDMPTTHWDVILVHFFQSRLDTETKRAWEMSLLTDALPTFDQLREFVERRCRSIEANQATSKARFGSSDVRYSTSSSAKPAQQAVIKPRAFTSSSHGNCILCKGDHFLGSCPQFIRLWPGERYYKAKDIGVCFNCLHPDHRTSNCTSNGTCRKCNSKHHSLLHYDKDGAAQMESTPKPDSTSTTQTNVARNAAD